MCISQNMATATSLAPFNTLSCCNLQLVISVLCGLVDFSHFCYSQIASAHQHNKKGNKGKLIPPTLRVLLLLVPSHISYCSDNGFMIKMIRSIIHNQVFVCRMDWAHKLLWQQVQIWYITTARPTFSFTGKTQVPWPIWQVSSFLHDTE